MTSDTSNQAPSVFTRRPLIVGAFVVVLGIVAVVVSQVLGVPAEWFRIAGLALCFLGVLAVGFGFLVRAANRSPRTDGTDTGA